MTDPPRVRTRDVTLGPRAIANAEHFEIREMELRLARAMSISTHHEHDQLVAIGQLLDGRQVRMVCLPALPGHIIDLRLV